jgi:cell wall-associated NlpC family hydrolase
VIYVDLLGIPYKFNGRDLEGLDCWGLCLETCRRAGLDLPEYEAQGNGASIIDSLIEEKKEFFQKIDRPEPYCLVTFFIKRPFVSHIGMVMEDCLSFIHALQGRNVAVERLDHRFWQGRIEGFYKWQG